VKLGFEGNHINPCVFYMKNGDEFCLLCIYVDDRIITGLLKMMEETIEDLNKAFKIKLESKIQDFLVARFLMKMGNLPLVSRELLINF
jgi:hypothetical protein